MEKARAPGTTWRGITRRSTISRARTPPSRRLWRLRRAAKTTSPSTGARRGCRSSTPPRRRGRRDRKSTRLNSSHLVISYAVFCLKKKKKQDTTPSAGAKNKVHTESQSINTHVHPPDTCPRAPGSPVCTSPRTLLNESVHSMYYVL